MSSLLRQGNSDNAGVKVHALARSCIHNVILRCQIEKEETETVSSLCTKHMFLSYHAQLHTMTPKHIPTQHTQSSTDAHSYPFAHTYIGTHDHPHIGAHTFSVLITNCDVQDHFRVFVYFYHQCSNADDPARHGVCVFCVSR